MAAQAVAEHAVEGAVVHLAGLGAAAVVADGVAQVGAQGTGAQRLAGQQAEEVLAVDIFQLGEEVATGEALGEGVVQAAEVEVIAGGGCGEALVLVVDGQVFGVGRGAVLDLVEAATGEGQVADFLRGE
ncbi:hypothetical protein D9M69_581770 [compost metagenome]